MRALNLVQLIGNATRDAELRMTPSMQPVTTFTIATNREWTTQAGERQEESQFHRCVAWGKLVEICDKTIRKGSRVYVSGRLHTDKYERDGVQRESTEIVIDEMILLDRREDSERNDRTEV